jgi:hypothetical protein
VIESPITTTLRAGGLDLDPGEEQACGSGTGTLQVARPGLIAAGDPAGLAAVPMERLHRRRPRHEDADLQRLVVFRGHRQRIAQPFLTGTDQHPRLAVEAERLRGGARARGTLAAPIRSGWVP